MVNNMLKTNSKKAIENIKKEIMDAYEGAEEYYTYDGKELKKEYNDICKDIMDAFYNEKCKFDSCYVSGRISKQNLFMDWMQGLPTAFPVSDDVFLESASEWVAKILEETEQEQQRYSDEEAEKLACYLLYRELEKHANKAR